MEWKRCDRQRLDYHWLEAQIIDSTNVCYDKYIYYHNIIECRYFFWRTLQIMFIINTQERRHLTFSFFCLKSLHLFRQIVINSRDVLARPRHVNKNSICFFFELVKEVKEVERMSRPQISIFFFIIIMSNIT